MAVLTKTEICELALSHLGWSKALTDVDTDDTKETNACLQFYEHAVKRVLRDWRWPFATKEATLVWQTDDPTTEWAYAYQYPADCLRIRRIYSGTRPGKETSDLRIPYRVVYGKATADPDGLAESQTTSGAANLVLNGVWADLGTALTYAGQEGRLVTITSSADDSGITFTVTGTDRDGTATSEAITGPNTTTVTGSTYHMTISTIATSGATTGNVTAGMSTSFGKEIYTDAVDAVMEYTAYISEEDRYDRDFGMTLSYLLASYIAPRITGGDSFNLADRAMQMYAFELDRARANAAEEEQLDVRPNAEWIRARD